MAENKEFNLLLVVSEAAAFEAQVKFLRRRGWTVNAVTTLREAIEFIASHHPDFVLISVNHPNPKVIKMPAIISQTFNCRSILIGESLDTQTAAALTKSGWRDVIHAPVSGPGIQLRVKQIMAREKQDSQRMEQEMAERAKLQNLKKTGESFAKNNPSHDRNVVVQSGEENKQRVPSIAEQIAQRAQDAETKKQSNIAYVPTSPASSSAPSKTGKPAVNNFAQGGQAGSQASAGAPQADSAPGAQSPAHQVPQTDQGIGFQQPPPPTVADAVEDETKNRFADLPEVEPEENFEAEEFDFTASGSTLMDAPGPEKLDEPTHEDSVAQAAEGAMVQPGTGAGSSNAIMQEGAGAGKNMSIMQEGAGSSGPGHYNPQTNQSTFDQSDREETEASANPGQQSEHLEPPQEANGNESQNNVEPAAVAASEAPNQPVEPASIEDEDELVIESDPIDVTLKRKMPKPAQLTSGAYEGTDMATILRIMREAFEECVDMAEDLHFGNEQLFMDTYYISIESISGFLVYVSKSKYQIDSHLVPKINTRIIEGLKQGGFNMSKMQNIEATHLGSMELSIDTVYQASLLSLLSGTSDGDNLVLSFLDTSRSHEGMIFDEEKQMIGFPVDYIPSDVKAPFQVFLYLPVNKKYYLYLNEGNSFSQKQLEKLDIKGVKHLFVKQAEREKLDDFFLSKRLKDKFKKSS